jgi:aspartate/methionine/tyrosine aminotransferase
VNFPASRFENKINPFFNSAQAMKYTRMPIEVESPEQLGYSSIECNLAESSVSDALFGNLGIDLNKLVLCYGDHLGKPELRELIASEATGISASDVLLTPGAAAALFIVSSSLLEKQDHLIVMRPNYATNIETPRAIGCEISFLDLEFSKGFRPDIQKLESLIRPNTKYISITCPHNPTGVLLSLAELKEIIRIAEKHKVLLLVDETYRDLTFENKLPLAASLSDQVISVSSVSKAYGLPGIRMGWLITRNKALQELFLAAKEQIFLCNSVVDEEIAFHYLNKSASFLPAIRKHLDLNFSILKSWLDAHPVLEWVKPGGGVVCFPRIRDGQNVDVERFYKILLSEYATYPGPGHWFEMDKRFMRIGYGWPSEKELSKGLRNIDSALKQAAC